MSTKHLNVNQFSFELALNILCCDILIIFQLIKHACQIMNYYFTNILQHKTNLNKSCVATLIVVQDKKKGLNCMSVIILFKSTPHFVV